MYNFGFFQYSYFLVEFQKKKRKKHLYSGGTKGADAIKEKRWTA